MPFHLDAIIEQQLFVLEHAAPSKNSRFPFKPGNDGRPSLAAAALGFYGLRETDLAKGRAFSDKAKILLEKMRGVYPQVDFAGVKDFWMRQRKVVLEGQLAELNKRLDMIEVEDEEGSKNYQTRQQKAVAVEEQLEILKERSNMLDFEGEEGTKKEGDGEMQDGVVDKKLSKLTDEKTQPTIPTTRLPANSPFQSRSSISFRVRSVNTATRAIFAKTHSPSLILLFDKFSTTYGLEETGISDTITHLLHHLEPKNLGYVAYCPGSRYVHTRSVDYSVVRKATLSRGAEVEGGYVNMECDAEEEAEDLVMHFEEWKNHGVKIDRVGL
ncbi:MAG: hypothetical protein Q9212_007326 [Teloschistes hypoglaucus]